MKELFIADLKVGDQVFDETFAVKSYKKGATRNNKPFIDIELADNSGSIRGKIWSDDMANAQVVEEGDVVTVNGTVEDFMGAPQLKITNLTKTKEYKIEDLQQKSQFDIEKMWSDVEDKIKNIKNPHLKKLCENIFDKETTENFKKSPAAYRVHHAYVGGLLEHIWEMLKMTDSLKSHYPKINMDIVNTGIILHDIGKMLEFETETTIVFTDQGKLLGHVFLGADKVRKNAPKDMPQDLLSEVLHIVLSHHGELEYGSPIVPMTTEAIAVYGIDHASAKLNTAYQHIHGTLGSETYTQYVRQLGTELYRSPYIDDLANKDIPF